MPILTCARNLGRAGLAAAQTTYNWGAVSEAYERMLASLVEKPK